LQERLREHNHVIDETNCHTTQAGYSVSGIPQELMAVNYQTTRTAIHTDPKADLEIGELDVDRRKLICQEPTGRSPTVILYLR
jgi:hypothetical protein